MGLVKTEWQSLQKVVITLMSCKLHINQYFLVQKHIHYECMDIHIYSNFMYKICLMKLTWPLVCGVNVLLIFS